MLPGTVAVNTPPANDTLVRFDAGPSMPFRNQPRSVRSFMSHGSWNERVAKPSAAAALSEPPSVTDGASNGAGVKRAATRRVGKTLTMGVWMDTRRNRSSLES